ncbi:hypothetical protein DL240_06710 [Lujinxingia litoralis]|uniref:TNFR-Cys domain-containing protein n=1 Tax=Lujinxingia litoralis TaxID=2211119 RepID=A0A328CA81_9DELT|nr:hypothetical protein [Lujinxingia litoralis]RAL23838.1 hypothetical protein DL240_06710 [Lujinxingia litoralis]
MMSKRRIFAALMVVGLGLGGCSFDPQTPAYSSEDDTGWNIGDPDASGDSGADVSGSQPDTGAPDTGTPDTGTPDTGTPDTGTPDTGTPDTGTPDTGAPDTGTPDTGTPDTGTPDSGTPPDTCDGMEVDLLSDPLHCGACGNACDEGFGVCLNGQCECSGQMEACGQEHECVEVMRDANNCGSCGNTCPDGAICNLGQCECRPGLTLCGGECVDTERDPRHCGACDTSCNLGHCQAGTCGSGGCEDWVQYECSQGAGLACIPLNERVHALYCGPEAIGGNTCGEVCSADQICRRSWGGVGCTDVRPARGCLNCPCDDCEDDERCRDDLPTLAPGAYCVER